MSDLERLLMDGGAWVRRGRNERTRQMRGRVFWRAVWAVEDAEFDAHEAQRAIAKLRRMLVVDMNRRRRQIKCRRERSKARPGSRPG